MNCGPRATIRAGCILRRESPQSLPTVAGVLIRIAISQHVCAYSLMPPSPPRCPPRCWAPVPAPRAAAFLQHETQWRPQSVGGCLPTSASSDTSRKVRDIRGPVVGRLLKHDGVYHFSPALFKIELTYLRACHLPSWPATVMVPGFVG